ncbi:MAG TPA: GNAT family N-acetyltransferase [Candidatus Bathyarchaeia archaeon]|jgi:GNAT superfamily N-acetyltransferase|nr:GNAT family N-acetyltransferase [Candidatus Bathyarchaeia archaeon]
MAYTVRELSVDTYRDFERLAMQQGGCWCMYYQREKPIHGPVEQRKRINQRDKKVLVKKGKAHAILVYSSDTPVGWCQYGTREELPRIDAGRGYKNVGPPKTDEKLWRITCFFVDKAFRGKGVSKLALQAALESIKKQGGGIVEAYPVISKKMAAVAEWRWFGTPRMFEREGFKQVGPLGTTWVLMRKTLTSSQY